MSYIKIENVPKVFFSLFVICMLCTVYPAWAGDLPVVMDTFTSTMRGIFSVTVIVSILGLAAIISIIGWISGMLNVFWIGRILIGAVAIGAVDGVIAWAIRLGSS